MGLPEYQTLQGAVRVNNDMGIIHTLIIPMSQEHSLSCQHRSGFEDVSWTASFILHMLVSSSSVNGLGSICLCGVFSIRKDGCLWLTGERDGSDIPWPNIHSR
jgi:hypothetical protein